MANVFVKFGGIKVLKNILLKDNLSDDLKSLACIIIGELAQNNPNVQDQMLQQGLLDDLCIITVSCQSSKLCLKSLYGLSCIVRGHKLSENRFFHELNGPILLQRLFQRNDNNCNTKILFFFSALLTSDFINYSTLSTYCDILLETCYTFLLLPSFHQESDMAINVIQSLTQTIHGKQYIKLHQDRILQLLNDKYHQIVEEHQLKKQNNDGNNSDEDIDKYTLNTITEIIEIIKNNQIIETQDGNNNSNNNNTPNQQQEPQETILRLCG